MILWRATSFFVLVLMLMAGVLAVKTAAQFSNVLQDVTVVRFALTDLLSRENTGEVVQDSGEVPGEATNAQPVLVQFPPQQIPSGARSVFAGTPGL